MELKDKTIAQLAIMVRNDWKNVYFGAKPYIVAMSAIHADDGNYGAEDAKSICTYFLCNAQTWRGDTARAVKAEIKRRFKIK